MTMYQNLGNFLDNYGSPFFVGSLVEKKVLFVNKAAKIMFDCNEETCDFEKIFERTEERLESLIEKGLKTGKNSIFYNFTVNTASREKIVVDFQFGFFNDEKTAMFLEIIPQQDTRLQMAQNQIRHSPRAEAILNFDEKLSIVDCSEAFHKVFESSEELRHSHFKNDLVNGFLPEVRDSLIADIHKTLETSEIFSTEIKVFTATGEEKWYRFDLQKRELDNSGVKLMCYMVNIEKQIEVKEQFALTNQYLSVVQKSTVDILYRVDIINNIMYHYSNFTEGVGVERAIPDYVNVFLKEETIHPDDQHIYLQDFKNFYEKDIEPENPVRFSINGQPFQWYKITAEKIFDTDGTLKEVFGALVNVENEHKIQEEVTTLNQYYETMKSLSDESLYVFDLKTRMLHLGGLTSTELGLPDVMSGYPESIHYLIHPEDLEGFVSFSQRSLGDNQDRLELRFQNTDGSYQWYELLSNVIFDESGTAIEILGRIKNIQKSKKMQSEVNTYNRYFDIMQEFSTDILYRVDVPTQTLYHAYQTALSLRIGTVVPNYIETLVNERIVHPDDAQMYIENTEKWLEDDSLTCEMRLNLVSEEYNWYSVKRKKIYDDDGNLIEIFGALVNIHKERELAEKFEESSQYFSAMQALSDDIFYRVEVDTMTLHHALQSTQKITQSPAIPDYVNAFIREKVIHPDDVEKYVTDLERFYTGDTDDITARFALTSDEYHWYRARSRKIFDEQGNVTEIWGRLISEHHEKIAHAQLSEISQQFNAMQELSDDILFRIDIKENTFYHSNEETIDIGIMLKTENYVETFIANGNIHPDDVEHYRKCNAKLKTGELSQYEMRAEILKGVYHAFDVKCTLIYSPDGEPIEIFGRMKNIQKEKELQERAYHDLMTGALNKATFEEQGGLILDNANSEEKYALIFIDLDDFKTVNDTLGHSYGDALLSTVGKRLKRLIRGDDLVGRIGGDEFAVMLRNVDSEESVLVRTNLMLESLGRDFSFEKKVVSIKASVGVALYPQHGTSYKDLIGNADLAVYESKRRGKNVVSMYSEELKKF